MVFIIISYHILYHTENGMVMVVSQFYPVPLPLTFNFSHIHMPGIIQQMSAMIRPPVR